MYSVFFPRLQCGPNRCDVSRGSSDKSRGRTEGDWGQGHPTTVSSHQSQVAGSCRTGTEMLRHFYDIYK